MAVRMLAARFTDVREWGVALWAAGRRSVVEAGSTAEADSMVVVDSTVEADPVADAAKFALGA